MFFIPVATGDPFLVDARVRFGPLMMLASLREHRRYIAD